jgi:hypothetical protein
MHVCESTGLALRVKSGKHPSSWREWIASGPADLAGLYDYKRFGYQKVTTAGGERLLLPLRVPVSD